MAVKTEKLKTGDRNIAFRIFGPPLPFGPLESVMSMRQPALRVFGASLATNFYRARRRGYTTMHSADQFADALGMHPTEIWGREYYEVLP